MPPDFKSYLEMIVDKQIALESDIIIEVMLQREGVKPEDAEKASSVLLRDIYAVSQYHTLVRRYEYRLDDDEPEIHLKELESNTKKQRRMARISAERGQAMVFNAFLDLAVDSEYRTRIKDLYEKKIRPAIDRAGESSPTR